MSNEPKPVGGPAGKKKATAPKKSAGPKMTVEGDSLVVEWRKDQIAEAMGMTLADILKAHLLPQFEATKTRVFTHRGVIIQTHEYPDWNARLKALKLVSQLYGVRGGADGRRIETRSKENAHAQNP